MALLVTVLRSFLESELSQLGKERSKIAKDAAEFLFENSHHPAWKEEPPMTWLRSYRLWSLFSCGEET